MRIPKPAHISLDRASTKKARRAHPAAAILHPSPAQSKVDHTCLLDTGSSISAGRRNAAHTISCGERSRAARSGVRAVRLAPLACRPGVREWRPTKMPDCPLRVTTVNRYYSPPNLGGVETVVRTRSEGLVEYGGGGGSGEMPWLGKLDRPRVSRGLSVSGNGPRAAHRAPRLRSRSPKERGSLPPARARPAMTQGRPSARDAAIQRRRFPGPSGSPGQWSQARRSPAGWPRHR